MNGDNDAAVIFLVIAAILFALDFILALVGDARAARIRLISAGLLALAVAFIVERT